MSLLTPIDLNATQGGRSEDSRQLDGLKNRLSSLRSLPDSESDEALWEVARGFEEMFLDILMRTMRKVKLGPDMLGDSSAGELYQSMFDDELCRIGSEGDGLGLSRQIHDYLVSGGYGRRMESPVIEAATMYRDVDMIAAPQVSRSESDSFSGDGQLAPPVRGRVTSGFGTREDPLGAGERFHSGIDIACPKGTPVRSAGDGRVAFAGNKGGYGLCVIVDHSDGLTTLYGHQDRLLVRAGDPVERGQALGLSGDSGRSTGPHLHFEVRRDNMSLDPMQML